jgi:hypothetical protein
MSDNGDELHTFFFFLHVGSDLSDSMKRGRNANRLHHQYIITNGFASPYAQICDILKLFH